ncbi:UvrABC system protein A [compost metagenome]
MGPEGGSGGGTVLATGTPEKLITVEESYTGRYLKPILIRDTERTEALELQTSETV